MNPNLVTAVRKRRGLDHQGLPLESTSPYGGLSEADLNATGPLEGPAQPPPELPQPAAHEVAVAQQALDETEAAQPRPGSVPAQVGQAVMAAAPVDHDAEEMAAAQEADRNARNNGRIELAAKQFVSGVTQTPQAGVSQAGPAQVPQAQARAKSRREQVADELMRRRQAGIDQQNADENKSQAELRRAQVAKLLMEKNSKDSAPAELETYKAVMAKRYPDFAEDFMALSSMKGAQDLQNAAEGKLTRESNERVGDKAAYRGDKFKQDAEARADADAKAKKLEADAAAFGKDVSGRAVFSKRLAELESTIPKSGSVPGTGVLGDALAWFDAKAGTDFQSPEAIKVRQNIGLLMSAILREQSGATVSEQEYARAVQNGLSTQNAATTREALRRLRDEFAITERDIRAKYSPEAVSLYEGRQKKAATPETPPIPAQGAPVKYLVSPDRKRRVPVFTDGSKGPEEPNPNG